MANPIRTDRIDFSRQWAEVL